MESITKQAQAFRNGLKPKKPRKLQGFFKFRDPAGTFFEPLCPFFEGYRWTIRGGFPEGAVNSRVDILRSEFST